MGRIAERGSQREEVVAFLMSFRVDFMGSAADMMQDS
jgi:hypothetical protein